MTVKHLSGGDVLGDPILKDFIRYELSCEGIGDDLRRLIEMGNLLSFEYECNQYNVMYDGADGIVTIRDSVHEEHSIPEYFKRISMSAADFLEILSECGEL